MKDKTEALRNFIEESKKNTQARIDELMKDERADEARAFRAAYNIYDVFTALIGASEKKANGDESVFVSEFKKLAVNIPSKWRESLEEARKHNDAEKVMIEEAKLGSADAIVAKFEELF